MKLASKFLLCFPFLAVSAFTVNGVEISSAKLTEVVREVNYRSAADLDTILSAEVGLEVAGRDVLTTGGASRAELLFENDILTRLGSNSIFSFEPDRRILDLEEGLALIRVPGGADDGVEMRTPAATAAITGTTVLFSVQPAPDNGERILKTAVLEGEIAITYPDGQVLRLGAGQMAISTEGDEAPPEAVDVDIARMKETSGLINDFERDLGSEDLIEQAVNRQGRSQRAGRLLPTGLVIDGPGTRVRVDAEREIRERGRDAFDSGGALEGVRRHAEEIGEERELAELPEGRVFDGEMELRESLDEPGSYVFTHGEERHLATIFPDVEVIDEGGEVVVERAQGLLFDTIRMSGDLRVQLPLIDSFFFVAGDDAASPSFLIEDLVVEAMMLDGFDLGELADVSETERFGFVAVESDLEIRGENTFRDIEHLTFSGGDGIVLAGGAEVGVFGRNALFFSEGSDVYSGSIQAESDRIIFSNHGEGVHFDGADVRGSASFIVSSIEEGEVRMENTDVNISRSFDPDLTAFSELDIGIFGHDVVIDDSNVVADVSSEFSPPRLEEPEGIQGIHVGAQNDLVIRNSSELTAMIQHGEMEGGSISLHSGEGDIRMEGAEGDEGFDNRVEAGSVNAVAGRNIAIVDSEVIAWTGDIRLGGPATDEIDVRRSRLAAGNRIWLEAHEVNVNDSELAAEVTSIHRDVGNFDSRAGAEEANNALEGALEIFERDGTPVYLEEGSGASPAVN